MASARALAWIDRLVWTLIYGGVLGLILGIATREEHLALAFAGGVVLLAVRSRLRESPPGGAQSPSPNRDEKERA